VLADDEDQWITHIIHNFTVREVVTVSDSELDEEDEETSDDGEDDSDDLVAVEEDEESWAIAKLSMSWDIVP
jgi:hypothetical protein